MSKIMLVNVAHVEETRVAILEDGVLEQYEIETVNRTNIKGNIHNAVVENVHPALEAAFLRIGAELKGFLPLDEVNFKLLPSRTDSRNRGRIGQHLHPGQKLMVQVVREPFAGKPPTVTTYFSLPGRYLVLMPGDDSAGISRKIQDDAQRERLKKIVSELNPPEGFGLIVRTAGIGQSKTELQRDLRYLLRLWDSIQKASRSAEFPGLVYRERDLVIRTMRDYFTQDIGEVWIDNPETYDRALEFVSDVMPQKAKVLHLYTGDRPLFSKFNLEEQIESIYKRRIPLKGGGEIVIDGTEALTAIDVNSKGAPKQGDSEDNALQTNLDAAAEIARQLRLRDLGGLVVIDFIDMMAARNQKKVEKVMRDAMKADRAKYDVTRISKLGLMEIARQRIKSEKMGASYTTCPVCEGYGLIKNVEPAALAALRKLQTRCLRGDFGKVSLRVPPEVAHWILNHKREDLSALERRYQVRVMVEPKGSLLRHESEFEFFPRERVEVPPALVVGDRPAPPTPPDLADLERPEADAGPAAPPAQAGPQEPREGAEAGPEEGPQGRRRRRRRRRGGRGRGRGAEAGGPPAPPAQELGGAGPIEAVPDAIDDEDGEDALEEPETAPAATLAEGAPAGAEPTPGEAIAAPEGNGGRRRRRRRRGRRGRGGGAQPAAAGAESPALAVAEPEAAADDEPFVPRNVTAHELMPAATGGRRAARSAAHLAAEPGAEASIRPGLIRAGVRGGTMEILRALLFSAAAAATAAAGATPSASRPSMPVATFSIVARDPSTGQLGVAVQSHWFSVGSVVPWAEAGVGAVATQSFVEPSYGPEGLALMRSGVAPAEALRRLLAKDPHPDVRQVAFVDAQGRAAAHTGAHCIPGAGHHVGDGYTTEANLMLTNEVPDAMARAFEAAKGPLAERMLAALDAAQAVGGDIRGRQSAAILVVRAKPSDRPWTDRLVDLRIEDAPDPLAEMHRLLRLHRAYEKMNAGDDATAAGKMDDALRDYGDARAMVPDNDEFVFWTAVALVSNGRTDEALPLFAKAFRMNPSWMLLVPRLPAVGQLPATPGLVDRILATGPRADIQARIPAASP